MCCKTNSEAHSHLGHSGHLSCGRVSERANEREDKSAEWTLKMRSIELAIKLFSTLIVQFGCLNTGLVKMSRLWFWLRAGTADFRILRFVSRHFDSQWKEMRVIRMRANWIELSKRSCWNALSLRSFFRASILLVLLFFLWRKSHANSWRGKKEQWHLKYSNARNIHQQRRQMKKWQRANILPSLLERTRAMFSSIHLIQLLYLRCFQLVIQPRVDAMQRVFLPSPLSLSLYTSVRVPSQPLTYSNSYTLWHTLSLFRRINFIYVFIFCTLQFTPAAWRY